jgi:hypothetical protein
MGKSLKKPIAPLLLLAGLVSLLFSGFMVQSVFAHQTITIGNYQVEIGWVDEPPIVGQRNAIAVNISVAIPTPASAGSGSIPANGKTEIIDISRLNINVVYAGESKALTLQPLNKNSQNQYIAPILPTRPGKYTVVLSGIIGTTAANSAVQPEEVETADSLQFPLADPSGQTSGLNLSAGIAAAAMLIGMAALIISVISLRKNRR